MTKFTIDTLREKLSNRYVLAIIAGKKYREALNECTENNIFANHDMLFDKVIKDLIKEDSFESLEDFNPKEGI